MSQTSRPLTARLAPLLALATALLLAVMVALPAPARAHDTLLSSDPEDGATLETSPEAITLTYSADILEVSPLVRITDDSGTQLAEIVPTTDGPTVTAELSEPLPAGTYEVQWRVVSSDGHPIEGAFGVTVEQGPAEPTGPSDAGGADGDDAASDGGGAEASDGAAEASGGGAEATPTAEAGVAEDAAEGGFSMSTVIWILAVIVVGSSVAVYFIVRRRD